jgi:hypothetical protein
MPYRSRIEQMKAVIKRQEAAREKEAKMLGINQSLYGHNTIQARKQHIKAVTAELDLLSTKWKQTKLLELQKLEELKAERKANLNGPKQKYLESIVAQHGAEKERIREHMTHLTKTLRHLRGEKNGNGNGNGNGKGNGK